MTRLFFANNKSVLVSPSHLYTTPGAKDVLLSAVIPYSKPLGGCLATKLRSIKFGYKPVPNFNWDNECFVPSEAVNFFIDTTNTTMKPGDAFHWTFYNETGIITDTITTDYDKNVAHLYANSGSDSVKLYVFTPGHCAGQLTRVLNLRPTITPTRDNSYFENFENR